MRKMNNVCEEEAEMTIQNHGESNHRTAEKIKKQNDVERSIKEKHYTNMQVQLNV